MACKRVFTGLVWAAAGCGIAFACSSGEELSGSDADGMVSGFSSASASASMTGATSSGSMTTAGPTDASTVGTSEGTDSDATGTDATGMSDASDPTGLTDPTDPTDATDPTTTTDPTTDPTTGGGGDGPACMNPGDMVIAGPSGPANADQNCPTTMYPVNVGGAPGPVADVEVFFDASVATTSEFTLTLVSPGNLSVVLFDKHGGPFTDDFVQTLFDDGSNMPIATAPAPRTGCFSPDQPLALFDGQNADGTWNLVVQTCLFAVTIHSWELRLSF